MRIFLFFSLLLVAFDFVLSAQQITQTVKGQITDEQTRSPIIGATVMLRDADVPTGAVTDIDGYFKITNVPVGRRTLLVSSVGYESKTINELLVSSGKEVVLNIMLAESLLEMEELVIVADRQGKGQPLNDLASVSAISLSVEETSRYAATLDDPARAALSYAGVSSGGDDLLNEIVIRGNSPKGMLWRLEGVEIPNPNHFANIGSSAGGISMLSANMLSNSDFFTGAFPAQYGNASSGIFDLKLRQGNFETHEHSFQAGVIGIAASSEGPIDVDKRSSYLVNYRYSTLGLLDRLGIQILGSQEDIRFQDMSFKVHVPTEKAGSFSIWGLGGINTYSYKPDASIGDWWHEVNDHTMGVAGVTHVAYLNKDTYIESNVSGSGYFIDNLIDSLYLQIDEKERVQEMALRASTMLNHKFNARHAVRIGLITSRLSYSLSGEELIENDGIRTLEQLLDSKGHAGFYQTFGNWQVRINKQFSINSGIHMSHFTVNGDTYVEPRFGAKYIMKDGGSFSLGAGLHSRMESMAVYLSSEELTNGSQIFHNKNLGFTKAAHAVLGYERMLTTDMRLKSELYYQYLYNVPVWGDATTTETYLRSFSALNTYDGYTNEPLNNKGTGENYGLELTLEKFFTRGHYFMLTTSLYESLYRGVDGVLRDTRFNGNYIFNALGGKEFKLGNAGNNLLSINGRMIWAGGKRQAPILLDASRDAGYTIEDFEHNFEYKLPDYWRFDLGVSYRINKDKYASIVALSIQNTTGRPNVYGEYYNSYTDKIEQVSQVGIFPNLSYKVEF